MESPSSSNIHSDDSENDQELQEEKKVLIQPPCYQCNTITPGSPLSISTLLSILPVECKECGLRRRFWHYNMKAPFALSKIGPKQKEVSSIVLFKRNSFVQDAPIIFRALLTV